MVYLNNAATSFPKPDAVIHAVTQNLVNPPQEPHRGTVPGADPGDLLQRCRATIAALFNIQNASRIILTSGSTLALNYIIHGFVARRPVSHCLTSVQEHNSVLRPLNFWYAKGKLTVQYLSLPEIFNLDSFKQSLRQPIDFVILNHASNVTGSILPVLEIANLCAENQIPLVIDASQSAGCLEIDVSQFPGNLVLVFTGHKGLMGPQGTGGFYLGEGIDLFEPFLQGGTGIRSDLVQQPSGLPVYYEAGTPNLPGFTGLTAGVDFVRQIGVSRIGAHKDRLLRILKARLVAAIQVHAPATDDFRAGILSLSLAGWSPEDVGLALSQSFQISTRTGLHCAPLIHPAIGTWPLGTVRLSNSWFTTESEIEYVAQAINSIARS
jgi:cysteine desulfurase family protein